MQRKSEKGAADFSGTSNWAWMGWGGNRECEWRKKSQGRRDQIFCILFLFFFDCFLWDQLIRIFSSVLFKSLFFVDWCFTVLS